MGNQRYNFTTGEFSSSTVYGDTVKVVALANKTATSAEWSFTVPDLAPGNYRLRLKVWDSLINATAWDVRDFTVEQDEPDTIAPTVNHSSPGSEVGAGLVTFSGSAQDESGVKLFRTIVINDSLGNQRYDFTTGQFSSSVSHADSVKTVSLTNRC